MPRMRNLSSYATTVARDGEGFMVITYHSTPIVRFKGEGESLTVELRFGGYDTVTTRCKMNQAASQFGLPYEVYREKGQTYVRAYNGFSVRSLKPALASSYAGPSPLSEYATETFVIEPISA